jgi:hypothetical protein
MKKHTNVNANRLYSIDYNIFTLKEDGRMPLTKIARQIGVSPGRVDHRHVDLVQNSTQSPIKNPTQTGYYVLTPLGVRTGGGGRLHTAQEITTHHDILPSHTHLDYRHSSRHTPRQSAPFLLVDKF